MKCPACGIDGSGVHKSIDNGPTVLRRRKCLCGARWSTEEKPIRGSLVAFGGQELAESGQGKTGKAQNLATGVPKGGLGVSVSDPNSPLFPASSVPSEQSGSVSEGDQGVDPARERPAYPAAFEVFWSASWKEGSKGAALKAWKKARCPNLIDASPAMSAYLKAKAASGQAIAHVSSWLSAGGHLQTEWKLSPLPDRNAQPALRQAVPAPYHAPAKPVTADWNAIKPWPKEAKGSP
jgi:hypothetical protein